jgi:hypothetical protein
MSRVKTQKQLQVLVDEWNANHPIGTPVRYYARINPREDPRGIYKTRSEASVLGGHTPVVWLDGKSGCVALEACEPVSEAEFEAQS